MRERHGAVEGLTYLEAVVAVALLSIAIVMASPLLLRYHHYREGIFLRYRALFVLEGEIGHLKSLPVHQRPESYSGPFLGEEESLEGIPEATGRTLIERTEIPGLSRAVVSMTWEFSGRKQFLSREIMMRARGEHEEFD